MGVTSEYMILIRDATRYLENACRTDKLFTFTNRSNEPMQKLMDDAGYSPSGTVYNLDEGDPELFYFKRITSSGAALRHPQLTRP
jgi:hypothetical protein